MPRNMVTTGVESAMKSTPDAAGLRRLAKREPAEVARRFEVVALLLDGQPLAAVSRSTGMDRQRVRLWRDRFATSGVAGLREDRRAGARPTDEQLNEIEDLALHGALDGSRWFDWRTQQWHESNRRVRLTSREIAARVGLPQRAIVSALRDTLGLSFRSGRWYRLSAA
jgi:hypothetical protein